jgi:hypothetical protein
MPIDDLRVLCTGAVYVAGEPGYAPAAAAWNLATTHRRG